MPSLAFPALQPVAALQSLLSSIQLKSPVSPVERPWQCNPTYAPSSPIQRLPETLLVNVFTYALCYSPNAPQTSVDPFVSPTFSWKHLESPFVLSHVCRRWMAIVNSTKHLWHSISIYRPDSRHIYRTALWITRADTHPIDVALAQSPSPSPAEEEATMRLLEVLAYRVRTWKTFEIKITGTKFPKPLLRCFAGLRDAMSVDETDSSQQVALTNVAVTFDFNHRPPREWKAIVDPSSPVLPTHNLFNLIQAVPSLKFLHWNGRFTPGPSFSHTLETLELHSPISVEEVLERIPSCQELQQLYIHHLTKPNSVTFTAEHMAMEVDVDPLRRKPLPKLRRLGIASRMQISPILQGFLTPKLLVLELECREEINPDDVRGLLRDSACTLQAFGLWPKQMSAEGVAKWLKMKELQNVLGFKMLGVEVNDRILRMLNRPCLQDEARFDEDEGVSSNRGNNFFGHTLFPELKELILGSCNADIDVGTLQRTLGSRFWTLPDVTRTTEERKRFPPIPKTELKRAEIIVRDLAVDLVKYANMINTNGKQMKYKPITCLIRTV